MKQIRILTNSWLAAVLLAIVAWAAPQMAWAANGQFDTPSQAFSWYSKGPGVIHLKILAFDPTANRTLDYSTFYLKDSKGNRTDIFYFHESDSYSNDKTYVQGQFSNKLPDETLLFLTNETNVKPLCLIKGGDVQGHDISRNSKSDNCYAEFDWYYPPRFAGAKMTLCVEGQINLRNKATREDYKKDIGMMEFDDIMLDAYDGVPGSEAEEAGLLRIPVASDRAIDWVEAKYKNGEGVWKTLPRQQLEKDTYSAFLLLPACEDHDSLTITANVLSASIDKSNLPDATWPSELKGQLTRVVGKQPMIHGPKFLTATTDGAGAVHLKWQITDPKAEDMFDGDVFDVQRSLTGKLDDYVSIGQLIFETATTDYEHIDSTLIASLTKEQMDAGLGIPLVRYRVARASVQQLWGTAKNPALAYVQPQFNTFSLLRPKNASAEWTDVGERKIQVKWEYEPNADNVTYVWDERAEMRVEVMLYNRAGQRVDSISRVLTAAEVKARKIGLELTRSCVKYALRIVVDGKTSPIGQGEGNLFALISSQEEFYNYTYRIYNGKSHAPNIILGNDFTINPKYSDEYLAVEEDKPFEGNFNGNGHKLTVSFYPGPEDNIEYMAPLRFAGNGAVFCNLTTAGTINPRKKFSSGLVGTLSTGELFIENCVSEITIKSKVNGDGSHGGFVGIIDLNSGTDNTKCLRISNSMFAGDLSGANTTNWGGFVGWRRMSTFGMFSNCYFNPVNLLVVTTDGNATFMRDLGNDPHWGIIQDCKYSAALGKKQGTYSKTAPDNGCWKDGRPAVRQMTFSTPTAGSTCAVSTPDDQFYYESTGKVLVNSLVTETLQSSVLLKWEKDEGSIDYFEVQRRNVTTNEEWKTIATQLIDTQYEDKTVSPVFDYIYRVSSNNDCEGKQVTYTQEVAGNCVKTGKVEGYVRFADGTGIPGVTVTASQYGDKANPKKGGKATTDEAGFFSIEGLEYWGYQKGEYQLTLSGVSGDDLSDDCKGGISVTFDHESNYERGRVFTVVSGVKFSGLVMYHGTSIPVHGARFLVDGKEIRSAGGPVESDFEGKFSFRMLKKNHVIQAVMDGHDFYKEGYYYKGNEKDVNFDVDVANVYFYDDTRVKLIGRVAGGKVQGELPLDNSLSTNNLGANLKMVFTLEGDNSSWLVFDNVHRTITERDTTYIHPKYGSLDKNVYKTRVHTNRHRMEVWPDSLTGEYQVLLPPVKWKIQQITAEGYPTLFQEGKTNDVIDLTDSLTVHTDIIEGNWRSRAGEDFSKATVTYHAKYSRIYRSPVLLERKQVGYDKFDYFGDRTYMAQSLVGAKSKVPLVYQAPKAEYLKDKKAWTGKDSLEVRYTFGHPVFSTDRGYPILLSAVERYYYNNNVKSDTVDVVKIDGGFVTIRNGLVSGTHRDTLSLDENGEGYYVLRAETRPYLMKGEDALSTVTFTMERDGVTFEGEPLKAYTLSQYTKAGAKDYMSIDSPILIDVLRDPPGGGSSAKLSKGTTLKLAYQMDMAWKAGLTLGLKGGTGLDSYAGVVTLAIDQGVINHATGTFNTSLDLIFSGTGQRAFSYTMTANEDISTDAGSTMVGADADLYMGVVNNIFLKPTIAIRAIPDSTFRHKIGQLASGRMVEIARGYDEKDSLFHLVRDEAVGLGQTVKSNFIHSQTYIVKQLIPGIAEQATSLLYSGSRQEAQTLADATGKRVYLSLLGRDHKLFGTVNTDSITKEYVYNSTIHPYKGESTMSYLVVVPNGDNDDSRTDEIYQYAELMSDWVQIIQQNEKEKLEASELVKNFDMDGGGSITYSEDFSSDYVNSHSYVDPFTSMYTNFFAWDDVNNHTSALTTTLDVFAAAAGFLGPVAAKFLASIATTKGGKTGITSAEAEHDYGYNTDERSFKIVEFKFFGTAWKLNFSPVLSFGVTPKQTIDSKYNRKESFTIKMDKKSHLNFDVYRVKTIDTKDSASVNATSNGDRDIFIETNFLRNVDYVKYFIDRGVGIYEKGDFVYPKSFVYRTRAGATVRPWENERKTLFYRNGTVLDERTKKVENPIIKMDRQSISGVPHDEPARFKLYMTNESEHPEAIGGALQYFTLYLDETTNPNGARLMVDGLPLSRDGLTVQAVPGVVTTKTLEVWAGEEYDYENLKIGLISQGDVQCVQEVAFSVHFLRTAGNVEIATPGDKWIMNTDAPFDEKHGWYLPVIISGFNKNQKNFDHIEFQYKESTRGDDYWTNLCAFYADSTLYRQATGTHKMIPENGNIVTEFYGEGTVMEKAYDLRARLYCRNGNSFITSDSKVLTGIKDTRRPQLFGAPDPKDGIIGPGENIVFNFSEAIEHNYLQQATNFEVVGETNETALSEEPSLLFSGKGYAETDARRNFANKNMTIDLMVSPDDTGNDMPLFSHGIDGHNLQLWLTKDWHLRAVVDDVSFESDKTVKKGGLRQVALILDNDHKQVLLYNDSIIGSKDDVAYNGYGSLIFGATNEVDIDDRSHYSGRMMEARLWNRAMTESLLNTYGKRLLTGYEMGLVDYYPMNDGESKYAVDKAQGANAELHGATWSLPRGMSLRLDWDEKRPVKGMQLRQQLMERSAEQDYTLMFWFKTNEGGQGALLSNGSGRKTDDNARHKFYIGFEGGQLKYRTNGREVLLGKTYADDEWHHFAITVDRSHKLANIWVDCTLRSTLPTDTLGGMLGNDFYVGNMVWHEAGADVQTLHSQNALTGRIDELCLFAQALPPTLLKRYSTKSPSGLEKGLLLYMGFNRQERQENNELELVPYALNQQVKRDMDGKATNQHDSVFVDPVSEVLAHIDRAYGAPVQASKELRNLNFSFVGKDNQLLVNIDEQDARINKRNLYVTVTDIPDLNGNYMASPATQEFFVDRNPLRWERKSWEEVFHVYNGVETYDFEVKITNTSGAVHQYTVENLPRWLTVNKLTDVIDQKGEHTLRFSISNDLNVGTYDEVIYLTDENGLSEPLSLTIRREGNSPVWYVDDALKHYSMNVVGQVKIGDAIVTDAEDFVGAFDAQGRCLGVANVSYNPNTAQSLIFMTVFDSTSVADKTLSFKLWHNQTGQIMMLETDRTVKFTPSQVVGSVDDPVLMKAGSLYFQQIDVNPGWNWISFNVDNNAYRNPDQMLSQFDWKNGDIVTDDTDDFTFIYNEELGTWLSNRSVDKSSLTISPKRSYRIYVHDYVFAEIPGYPLRDESQRTLTVKHGWNNIGYTPMINLPVTTALADYSGVARNRDVVKSREQFAVYTELENGGGYWSGSLQYMKPGEGYMLYRNAESEASFRYPFYEPGSTFFEETVAQAPLNSQFSILNSHPFTMSLAASVVGVELQEGDRLLAFSEGELRGAATAIDSVFYVSISGEEKAPLSFAIEREGEIIASTAELMVYERNAVSGSPMAPTAINFVPGNLPQHGWYTVEGYKLDGKPTRKGVYIYNGKKQIVK